MTAVENPGQKDEKDQEEDARMEKLVAEVKAVIDISSNVGKTFAVLQCRSIRVGSYKSMPKEKSYVTENAIQIRIPATNGGKHHVLM